MYVFTREDASFVIAAASVAGNFGRRLASNHKEI